jgi:glycosyltransferase involved in cell wall biosynthesis
VVAFVGRLTAIKRPDRFVDMALAVAAARPETRFLVAGEGDLLPQVRGRAQPLGERIRFLGWRPDVETVHAAADLTVLTSDNEGMPVSLIEAAMTGRPAVTTDVGSAAEVVAHGHTGFVTAPDADRLAAAVLTLLGAGDLRRTFGEAAAARARRLFTAERLVADTERLYEALAGEATR